jgi:type VI secretion system protein ImpJ
VLESRLSLRLGGGQAGPALQHNQTRQLVARVQSLLARLDDLDQGIGSHPFVLYRALRELYFDVCVFVEVGAAVPPPYRHDDPSGCFAALTALFAERLGPATRTTETPFVRQSKPPVYLLPEVPEAARQASEVYLLVRGAGTDPATIESLKLAALGRLPLLHSRVLQGVPIHHLPDPPFPHAFAPEVGFYLLGRNAEWQLAVREGTLAFHAAPVLETCQVSLFWR